MLTLDGVSDLHVHTGPDIRPRSLTDVEAVAEAEAAGQYAIILKSHWTCTADRAVLAASVAGAKRLKVFGGLALDYSVGGLNVVAVEKALQMGAKEVWFPTHDAASHRRYYRRPGGISIVSRTDPTRLRDEAAEIVDLVGQSGAIIGSGHIGSREIMALALYCRPKRYKLLVSHPEWHSTRLPLDVQRDLAALGAVFERCVVSTLAFEENTDPVPAAGIVHQIRSVGVSSSILSSDLGQRGNPRPVEGLRGFVERLLAEGMSRDEIRAVTAVNPRALIDHDRREA